MIKNEVVANHEFLRFLVLAQKKRRSFWLLLLSAVHFGRFPTKLNLLRKSFTMVDLLSRRTALSHLFSLIHLDQYEEILQNDLKVVDNCHEGILCCSLKGLLGFVRCLKRA